MLSRMKIVERYEINRGVCGPVKLLSAYSVDIEQNTLSSVAQWSVLRIQLNIQNYWVGKFSLDFALLISEHVFTDPVKVFGQTTVLNVCGCG